MQRTHRFSQLDVFASQPFRGNPLAVVHDAASIDEAQMAVIARWTNLSETTFLLPPTDPRADYRVRIYAPTGELPFAGHPTLGSCRAWLDAGGLPRQAGRIVQECGVGLVTIRQDGDRLAFAAPPLRRSGPVDAALRDRVLAGLRVTPGEVLDMAWVDNGPPWIGILLRDAERVLALEPDLPAMGGQAVGVAGAYPLGRECAFEVRAFTGGGDEDPVTGSLNAGLALWLMARGTAPAHYVASQGTRLGRTGRVFVDRVDGETWIGGHASALISGEIRL